MWCPGSYGALCEYEQVPCWSIPLLLERRGDLEVLPPSIRLFQRGVKSSKVRRLFCSGLYFSSPPLKKEGEGGFLNSQLRP